MRRGHFVYLARSRDGSYYAGYSVDPARRMRDHNAGKGAKALRGRRPVVLAFLRRFTNKGDALRYEIALKRRTHRYKRDISARWLARKGEARWTIV
jgi:putative endonuclease